MNKRIRFGLYQSCGNRVNVGRVPMFGMLWCLWEVGLGQGLEGWGGVISV